MNVSVCARVPACLSVCMCVHTFILFVYYWAYLFGTTFFWKGRLDRAERDMVHLPIELNLSETR